MNDLQAPQPPQPPQAIPPFENLYEAYYTPIYRRVYRMLGYREPAEDVTQETFLKALRAYGTIRPNSNIYAWLCRIAKNAVIDYVNHCKQARCTSLDALTWDLADQEATDPQTRYTGTCEHIATALAQLPAHERELLYLRCAGYTEVELARHFARTTRTIRGWLTHVRICLAQDKEVVA
jgi:RNA polymerase sigma-70 factor, ECF subfamily